MNKEIKIAILDAVQREYWADDEGKTDSQKFIDLLAPINPSVSFDVFYVTENIFPQSLGRYHGLLLTGSPASVHDDYDWISRLTDLTRQADLQNKRIVASCFGHQLVAKTFGGEVGFNENGWLIGNYKLSILKQFEWMQTLASETGLFHFNQERVTRLPEAAISFASTEAYPDYAYTLGDNILSVQGHPEQPLSSMNNFLDATVHQMDEASVIKAREKIHDGVPDSSLWGEWMIEFLVK